jgi:hypothetical protein
VAGVDLGDLAHGVQPGERVIGLLAELVDAGVFSVSWATLSLGLADPPLVVGEEPEPGVDRGLDKVAVAQPLMLPAGMNPNDRREPTRCRREEQRASELRAVTHEPKIQLAMIARPSGFYRS